MFFFVFFMTSLFVGYAFTFSVEDGLPSQKNGLPRQKNGLPRRKNALPSQKNDLPSVSALNSCSPPAVQGGYGRMTFFKEPMPKNPFLFCGPEEASACSKFVQTRTSVDWRSTIKVDWRSRIKVLDQGRA